MAKIIENPVGRRMVRLSAEDVLAIVDVYSRQKVNHESTYEEVMRQLQAQEFYLPEEV